MPSEEQEQAAAAVEITAVEGDIRRVTMLGHRIHKSIDGARRWFGWFEVRSVTHAGSTAGEELDQLGATHDRGARHEPGVVEFAFLEAG